MIRRWRNVGLAAAILVTVSAFALSGCGSSSATVVATRQAGVEVLLLPVLRGGAVGWCITVAAEGGCPISRLKRGPIVAEQWFGGAGARPIVTENSKAEGVEVTNRAEGFALTTSDVAAVAVSGSNTIATRSEPGLPQGLRAVTVKIQGAWAREVKVPSLFGRPPHEAPAGLPRFTPLDRTGKPLTQKSEPGALAIHEVAGRNWSRPASAPVGPCELHSSPLRGLVANAGFVVTRAKPVNGLIGRPFLACVSTSYSFENWPMVASLLVDARQPGTLPGALPDMRPVTGSPGLFEALGSNGPMVARHVPSAWLVVSGGEGQRQRLAVLRHLHATVRL